MNFIQNFFRPKGNRIKVFINYETKEGPWGGGNQFLKALGKEFEKLDILAATPKKATHILFNSHHELGQVRKLKKKFSGKTFVHRIDGPIFLVRGKDQEIDDEVFEANQLLADLSIFQSVWSLDSTLALGYVPVSPYVIINGADHQIFNRQGKTAFSNQRKTRIISSSWSDNPRKGGNTYQWLDKNLDFHRFDYTFVGRIQETLSNIKLIAPKPSVELAALLKQHDIYVTASDKDPCSNALIEALSCGLPAIYFNRGGHAEIVKKGGLGFESKEQIPGLLESISKRYDHFREAVKVDSIEKVAQRYQQVLASRKHEKQ